MLGKTHMLGGALLAGYVQVALGNTDPFVVPMAVGAAMGLLPDLDQRQGPDFYVQRMVKMALLVLAGLVLTAGLYPVEGLFRRGVALEAMVPAVMLSFLLIWFGMAPLFSRAPVKHRGVTHSLLGWITFVTMTWALAEAGTALGLAALPPSWRLAMNMGYASHILLDMGTVEGVQLLYPARRFLHLPLVPLCACGSWGEKAWRWLLTGGIGLFVVVQIL